MVLKPFYTDALNGLCSKDQLELLDSIDHLRSQGISHYVSLPQIIVCGDQSSGKSSVLEAISGVSFPTKSNLCTRFPTELVLRKTACIGVSVSIVPHKSHNEPEQPSLGNFHEKLEDFDGLPGLIESAKRAMGISAHSRAFSKDLLRIEISGPDRPHLTIVDLPGLIHSETKTQSTSDVELVKDVVQTYMKEPRSIILAVVSAKNDYANQIVLKLARTADAKGNRTLGVITKPDTLIPGSESEASYVSLAKNEDVNFRLGWHILKNLDSERGEWSLVDRNLKEEAFFLQGIWTNLPRSLLGVVELRDRLSKVLLQQIASELPSLIDEIIIKSDACRSRLDNLGEPRATLDEQRRYLLHISQSFQTLIKASVDGTYNDPFFDDAESETGYQKRIRAVMQNLNLEFAKHIATRGHHREITDSKDTRRIPRGVIPITRDDYLDHIQRLLQRSRGRELPGTFNPMIVADLFLDQSRAWKSITERHVNRVWEAAKMFLNLVVTYIADAATSGALFQAIFEPALDRLLEGLNAKTAELLIPHHKGHPITYNHDFTEALQRVRRERSKNEYSRIIEKFFGVSSLEPRFYTTQNMDLNQLVTALVQDTQPDINRFACSEALDCMEAYYKVALERFVDDIAVEVIERKLMTPLGDIFSAVAVSDMPADLVSRVAGESEVNSAQREELKKQLEVLLKGSDTCKRFIGLRLPGTDDGTVQLDPKSNSIDKDSGNSEVGSSDSFQEDLGPLSDDSTISKSPSIEWSESLEAEVRESREESIAPEADIVEEPQEVSWNPSEKKKQKKQKKPKKSKKSIILAGWPSQLEE